MVEIPREHNYEANGHEERPNSITDSESINAQELQGALDLQSAAFKMKSGPDRDMIIDVTSINLIEAWKRFRGTE